MEPLTFSLAIVGITEFIKQAVKQFFTFEVTGATTILVAAVVAAALTFVDLSSELIQNIYTAAVAVGGLTGARMVAARIGK